MSKFKRENFPEKNIVDGVNEVDLPMNSFNEFVFTGKAGHYTLTQSDIQRPDLISYKVYGSMDMWWMLMKYNKVEDVWNDLFVGMVLVVPKVSDLENYYRTRN